MSSLPLRTRVALLALASIAGSALLGSLPLGAVAADGSPEPGRSGPLRPRPARHGSFTLRRCSAASRLACRCGAASGSCASSSSSSAPGRDTTVVDVGVTDAPFGDGSSDNFFEALYPWPERITAVGHTELDRFAGRVPDASARCASDGREPAVRGRRVRPRLLERGRRARRRAAATASGEFVAELCRVARRVFVTTPNRWFPLDPHTLLPFVHWLPRGPAAASGCSARAASTTCSTRSARGARVALPVPGARRQPRDDARRGRARTGRRPSGP